MSSQVTFIYIALITIQIVSMQLHSDYKKIIQHRSIILLTIKCPQLSKHVYCRSFYDLLQLPNC